MASYSDANKMPVASLAKVFGPTIVGYSSETPQPSSMWKETQLQPKVSISSHISQESDSATGNRASDGYLGRLLEAVLVS